MDKTTLRHGDVVQIDPEHDSIFGGCFMLVTEPRPWGAQGFVQVPRKAGSGPAGGQAYYRCEFANMELVARAAWAPPDDGEVDDEN